MAETNRPLRVFLSHASIDKPAVRNLYKRLVADGFDAWIDEEKLLPGQDWGLEISKAIETSDAVIFCFSSKSVQSEGFVQRELRYAIDIARESPEGTIFLIPARLDECEIPIRLREYQSVNLYDSGGYDRLLKALKFRSRALGRARESLELEEVKRPQLKQRPKAVEYQKSSSRKRELNTAVIVALIGFIGTIISAILSSGLIQQYLVPVTPSALVSPSPLMSPTSTYTVTPTTLPSETITSLPNLTPSPTSTPSPVATPSQTKTPLPSLYPWLQTEPFVYVFILAFLPIGYLVILYSVRYWRRFFSEISNKGPFIPFSNPYIAGLPIDPISNPQMFFGRSDIVDMVSKEIKEPKQKPPLLLYGRRRMGKTSALLNLGRLVRDFFIVDIFIDSQDIKYRTDIDLTFNLIEQIMTKLKGELSIAKLFANEEKYQDKLNYQNNPIGMLSDFFSDCSNLLEKNNLYCLLMFDEYELLGNAISKDFFHQIRSTMQHKRRFVFLFTGTHLPNELSTTNWKEVFMNVKTLHISFLDRQDGYELLTKPVQNLRYSSEKIIEQILDVTGCQPLMLQAMGAEIINQLNIEEKRFVDKSIFKSALKKVVDAWGSNFFDHIWNSECDTKDDKELLRKVAKANGRIKASYVKEHDISLQKLMKRDLLDVENGYVKLTIPLIKIWLEEENHL